MIGIDTNVVLRVIVADEPKQAETARNFIRNRCSSVDPGYVSHITLVELVWTLGKAYQLSREDISRAVEQILETAQLDVESSNDVAAALKDYRKGTADFADCLLARVNTAAGCDYTITLDRKAARLTGFKLLSAR